MMSRSSVPTHTQVEMLLESLEEKRWLATGHARTSRERDRTRAAWQEIATKLNSERDGCYKNWERWSKYWKDKKSAVRRKAMQIRTAKQRAGDVGIDESLLLSDVEEKIVDLSGGKPFVSGDREIEIEIIYPTANESGPSCEYIVPEASDAELMCIQGITEEKNEEVDSKQFEGRPPPPPSSAQHKSNAPMASSPPKRRVMVRRPRPYFPPQPSSRTEMVNLTERFIAIEEKRLDNERLLIDNQQKMLDVLKNISEAWSKQSQALQELCTSIRRDKDS